jgi:hypothetical protein
MGRKLKPLVVEMAAEVKAQHCIFTRFDGDAYVAHGDGMSVSCTVSKEHAAERCAMKIFGVANPHQADFAKTGIKLTLIKSANAHGQRGSWIAERN